jgi:hypothetical protein
MSQPDFHLSSPTKRPLSVTLLTCLVLIFTGLHLVRFIRALQLWDFLVSLPGVPSLYLALTGVLWTIIGIPLLWLLWRGHPKTPVITSGIAVFFSLYFWIDRLFIANISSGLPNLAFLAAANAFLLAFTFWALINPKSSSYFKRHQLVDNQEDSPYLHPSEMMGN